MEAHIAVCTNSCRTVYSQFVQAKLMCLTRLVQSWSLTRIMHLCYLNLNLQSDLILPDLIFVTFLGSNQ